MLQAARSLIIRGYNNDKNKLTAMAEMDRLAAAAGLVAYSLVSNNHAITRKGPIM